MYQRTAYRSAPRPQPLKFKINDMITAPTVRALDDQGSNLGVMPLAEAVALLKAEVLPPDLRGFRCAS